MGSVGTKLDEAEFFYDKLTAAYEDKRAFRCYLSAFLAASRSVMQYIWNQVKGTPAQEWYDTNTQKDLVRFFKCKRNVEIHQRPVGHKRKITEHLTRTIHISDGIDIKHFSKERELTYEYRSPPPEKGRKSPSSSTAHSSVAYFFTDRPDENVCDLCARYLAELSQIVHEGVQQGHIQA